MRKAKHRYPSPEMRFVSKLLTLPQLHQLVHILELHLAGARVDHNWKTYRTRSYAKNHDLKKYTQHILSLRWAESLWSQNYRSALHPAGPAWEHHHRKTLPPWCRVGASWRVIGMTIWFLYIRSIQSRANTEFMIYHFPWVVHKNWLDRDFPFRSRLNFFPRRFPSTQ